MSTPNDFVTIQFRNRSQQKLLRYVNKPKQQSRWLIACAIVGLAAGFVAVFLMVLP